MSEAGTTRGLICANVGDRVRFNDHYLRATKRRKEPDATKVFVIVECDCRLCSLGKWVALDERCWVTGGPRHAALVNLGPEIARKTHVRKPAQEDAPEPLTTDASEPIVETL